MMKFTIKNMWFARRLLIGIVAFASLSLYCLWLFRTLHFTSRLSGYDDVFPISAYNEPGLNMVRIITMKHNGAHPKLYCSFTKPSTFMFRVQTTKPTATHSKSGGLFEFDALREFGAAYQGYITFCDIPKEMLPIQADSRISIRIYSDEAMDKYVQLPVRVGRDPKNQAPKKHRISTCMTPWFGTENFTASFLVEFIELQRVMGVTQLVIYLTGEPHPHIKNVLDLYASPQSNSASNQIFELKIVSWILPIINASHNTWYFDQILGFIDCLYRAANETDDLYFSDFDEILVPNPQLQAKQTVVPTWHELINAARNITWYNDYPALCFPSYYIPSPGNLSTERLIYDRTNATVEAYPERAKCLMRPTEVEEVHVHQPLKPARFRLSPDLAIIYHYRICLHHFSDLCSADTPYHTNNGLAPYRQLAKKKINSHLQRLKNIQTNGIKFI